MDMVQFGKLIKTLRQQQNMKQEEFASKLGVSISAVSKWETGKNLPDIELLKKISDLFQISMDDLCNPETYLDKLANLSLETTQSTIKEPITPPMSFSKLKIWIIAITISILLGCIGLYIALSNKSDEVKIVPYSFRTTQDEVLGTVFEIGCLYEGDIEELSLSYPLILSLCKDWQSNTAVTADIHYIKLSFYQDKADIHAWTTPDQVMYIYRE